MMTIFQIENDVIFSRTYLLGGIGLVKDQATQISFKNKEENPDSFLGHFHAFAGRVGPVWATGIGRVGPVWVLKS